VSVDQFTFILRVAFQFEMVALMVGEPVS